METRIISGFGFAERSGAKPNPLERLVNVHVSLTTMYHGIFIVKNFKNFTF